MSDIASLTREQIITKMAIELENHHAFSGDAIKSAVWATRMYEAARYGIEYEDIVMENAALIARGDKVFGALESLVWRWREYTLSTQSFENAYYHLAKYAYDDWQEAVERLAEYRLNLAMRGGE